MRVTHEIFRCLVKLCQLLSGVAVNCLWKNKCFQLSVENNTRLPWYLLYYAL